MNLDFEIIIALKILGACLAGASIGYDRARKGRDAGMRTYAAVCIGATLFTSIAEHLNTVDGMSRIISNIIVGIGFLGAGTIYKDHSANKSSGLTTAATIWCTAAVGITIGLDLFLISLISIISLYLLLSLPNYRWYRKWTKKVKEDDHTENGTAASTNND